MLKSLRLDLFSRLLLEILLLVKLFIEIIHVPSVSQSVFLPQSSSVLLHHLLNIPQNAFVFDGGRELVGLSFDDFPEDMSEYFATPCFRKFINNNNILERRNRPDFFSY